MTLHRPLADVKESGKVLLEKYNNKANTCEFCSRYRDDRCREATTLQHSGRWRASERTQHA